MTRVTPIFLTAVLLLTTTPLDQANAQAVVSQWSLNGNIDSGVPLNPLFNHPLVTASGLSASGLTTGVHLDAFMADGWPTGALDPDTYFEVTVTPLTNWAVDYTTMEFSLYNDAAGTSTWEIRSSVDAYASTVATGTTSSLTGGGTPVIAFLPGVGSQTLPVTFRFYTHTNSGAVSPQQRGLRGSSGGGFNLTIKGNVVSAPPPTTVTGRFLYEDRIWDKDGHTGTVQNLPIRHADVEIVDAGLSQVVASGSTDANGNFSFQAQLPLTSDVYARVISTMDNSNDYHVSVVGGGGFEEPTFAHAAPTDTEFGHAAGTPLDFGDWVVADPDGTGIAQAFNILDRMVDGADWLALPEIRNAAPVFAQKLFVFWGPLETHSGSFFSDQFNDREITIASPGSGDTDGWSDAVILHEYGHYVTLIAHQDDSPGGQHFLSDSYQDPGLSYGEGYPTYFCAEVREHVAATAGTDDNVSIYADMGIPPPVGTAGALEFSYDFETVTWGDGEPIAVLGQTSELNVTAVMWDLADGPSTPDESPGVDDDPLDGAPSDVWDVLLGYMLPLPLAEYITFEDFMQGWESVHGPAYLATEVDQILNDINTMGFEPDAHEPDDNLPLGTTSIVVGAPSLIGPSGGVVINELILGPDPADAVELYNSSNVTVDIGNYQIVCSSNEWPTVTYTFAPTFLLGPGATVVLWDGGDPADDTATEVYFADNIAWTNDGDGACALLNSSGFPVDFVRWDDAEGPSSTPVPPGTMFNGTLMTATGRLALARDNQGTDTDDASDFTEQTPSDGIPNGMPTQFRTFYDVGDVDEVGIDMVAGTTYILRTLDLISDADTNLELLDIDKSTVLDVNDNRNSGTAESEITFIPTQSGVYYARLTHVGTRTNYGMYNLVVYSPPESGLSADDPVRSGTTELHGTFPNPFNPRVNIAFEVDRPRPVNLQVYDARGRLVRQLLDEVRPSGSHTVTWNGTDDGGREVAGGVYFVRFGSEGVRRTTKVTLVK